jgi:hypothetical protein
MEGGLRACREGAFGYVCGDMGTLMLACTDKRYESGRGQPHSKTLRKKQRAEKRASILECGCPLPLFGVA